MSLKTDIEEQVDEQLNAKYQVTDADAPPARSSLTFGATARKLFCRVVFVDIRDSVGIVSKAGPLDGMKLHKAFLYAVAKCVRAEGGEPRSFGGDSVLSFFAGNSDDAAVRAVRAAGKIRYVLEEIVGPKFDALHGWKLDFGIGIGQGPINVGKSGIAGDADFQDLVWIGMAVYHAVRYGQRASKPKALWISKNVWEGIKSKQAMTHADGKSMWTYEEETFDEWGKLGVYKTTYRWPIS